MTAYEDTIGAAVERRGPREELKRKANDATKWLAMIGASHVNAPALVQLSLAQLDKIPRLREAAEANPASFLSAMAECARLGLMPGDTFYYVPFFPGQEAAERGKLPEVTGMVYWTGEVELIHRTGEVETVVCETVRAGDEFAWDPSRMRIPHHVVHPNEHGQVGLAEATDRGPLTGVYCYVRFLNGGTSHPTVMRRGDVAKHRAKSKAKGSFWGPEWPDEGPWTEDMWKKTGVHKHAGSVPISPEYRATVQAAEARAAANVPPGIELGSREMITTPDEPPLALPEGDRPPPTTLAGAVEDRRDARPPTKAQSVDRLGVLFRQVGLADRAWAQVRLAMAAGWAVDTGAEIPRIAKPADLTAQQAARAVAEFERLLAEYRRAGTDARTEILLWALADSLWDGITPPPPEGFTLPVPGDGGEAP